MLAEINKRNNASPSHVLYPIRISRDYKMMKMKQNQAVFFRPSLK
jgi:hypothetical protein